MINLISRIHILAYNRNFSKIQLPSNRKFGLFFSLVFFIISIYFYFKHIDKIFYFFGIISAIFLLITIIKAEILEPINKIWMIIGIVMGKAISPIVMGLIFFFIFSPISIFMKLINRDELLLKLKNRKTYWTNRRKIDEKISFRNQF